MKHEKAGYLSSNDFLAAGALYPVAPVSHYQQVDDIQIPYRADAAAVLQGVATGVPNTAVHFRRTCICFY
ncbi:MAG: hypothetical protein JXA20_00350 [Spirochaetes bacterium]|nr:hypothetical protein [Spirochaetota bacterium]